MWMNIKIFYINWYKVQTPENSYQQLDTNKFGFEADGYLMGT